MIYFIQNNLVTDLRFSIIIVHIELSIAFHRFATYIDKKLLRKNSIAFSKLI
jgi:hypothetical protein